MKTISKTQLAKLKRRYMAEGYKMALKEMAETQAVDSQGNTLEVGDRVHVDMWGGMELCVVTGFKSNGDILVKSLKMGTITGGKHNSMTVSSDEVTLAKNGGHTKKFGKFNRKGGLM